MARSERKLGKSLMVLMKGFREVENSVYATPGEKETVKAGIDAIITLKCYSARVYQLPYLNTPFDEAIDKFREVSDCWRAIEKAQKAYKKAKRRQAATRV